MGEKQPEVDPNATNLEVENQKIDDGDRLVTVCAVCNSSCCYHGMHMCDEAYYAKLVEMPGDYPTPEECDVEILKRHERKE